MCLASFHAFYAKSKGSGREGTHAFFKKNMAFVLRMMDLGNVCIYVIHSFQYNFLELIELYCAIMRGQVNFLQSHVIQVHYGNPIKHCKSVTNYGTRFIIVL